MTAQPWHFPEPFGSLVQPFGPDGGTVPLCSNWSTNWILPSVRNGLAASTGVVAKKITKSPSKITPNISCLFIIISLSLFFCVFKVKNKLLFFGLGVEVVVCLYLLFDVYHI